MDGRGKVYEAISAVVLVLGLIGGVIAGFVFPSVDVEAYKTSFNFIVMISCWVGTVLLFIILFGIASILQHLEALNPGNKEAKETLAEAENNVFVADETPKDNEWKCPKCGKINQNYVGTCGCGYDKK